MKSKRPNENLDVLRVARKCIENGNYRATFHAECRKNERDLTLLDALHVIQTGYRAREHDQDKTEFLFRNYAIEGLTLQEDEARVVISFDGDLLLIVTMINITKSP